MLRILRLTLSCLALSVACIASTKAQAEVTEWKKVGDWNIDFYSSFPGCAASTNYEGGTFFLIGLKKRDDGTMLEIGLLDDAWKSIEAGKEYSIKVYFGDESPWTLEMSGGDFDGTPGLSFTFDAYAENAGIFVDEFQREIGMKWYYQNAMLGHYSLSGTRQAFNEVVACQKSFNEAMLGVSDPFSGSSGGSKSDPFSR